MKMRAAVLDSSIRAIRAIRGFLILLPWSTSSFGMVSVANAAAHV
jgi:hypothetical protein